MSAPYYADDSVTLHHGDMREVMPELRQSYDLIVADPPYGETSLTWDRWPDDWPALCADLASSMWAFGSMRMFLARYGEFDPYWNLSQDIVWEKHNGSGFATDRFRRVHEHALHWYRGSWGQTYHETPVTMDATRRSVPRRNAKSPHTGAIESTPYATEDGGPRLMRSVIYARSMNHNAINETEKPIGILTPLIEYACPPGGIIVDPFAGSGSTAVAAVMSGRKAVLIEADEVQCEKAARRLSQGVLEVQP